MHTPIEELLKKTNSLFKLVNLASRRTAQLHEGKKSVIEHKQSEKLSSVALREIAGGSLEFKIE